MSRRRKQSNQNNNKNKYNFYLTNAFGKGKEHFGLEISSNKKEWTFLTLTHTPTGHYRLLKDPITGSDNPQSSFLNTSPRTKPIGTRLRIDKARRLSTEDEKNIDALISKKKSPIRANNGTSHSSDRQMQPHNKRDQISARNIKAKRHK